MSEGSDILNKLKESSRDLYSVPEGYFDAFPEQMLAQAKAEQPASVIPLGKRIFRSRFKTGAGYAAAAVIIGLIALGSWLWMNRMDRSDAALSQADQSALQGIQTISDNEIVAYIENSSLTATNEKMITSLDLQDLKSETASLMLSNISDEELQQYLEQDSGS